MTSRNNNQSFSSRFAYVVGILALSLNSTNTFTPSSNTRPLSTTFNDQISNNARYTATSGKLMMASAFKSSPVAVSEEAEALSHSETTLKLIPSFELFQILAEEEGGSIPIVAAGNSHRDGSVLKIGKQDTLADMKLSDYAGCGGTTKIETLPDPFKMVEKELKPFADSISELVSSDQPILSMAAKHFFEKRHGKRFRPTIVQLAAKAVAAAEPEQFLAGAGIGNAQGVSSVSDGLPSVNKSTKTLITFLMLFNNKRCNI
jgi:hypothetical protein